MTSSSGGSVDRAAERAALAVTAEPASLVAVVGPTASGKTELSVRLAELIGGEIVSADSVQIYRFFDVGSGKPTADETRRARHHLVGVLDPLDTVDAARYAELATGAIREIRARGRRPIVCGGTFFWVKALLYGLAGAPPAEPAIRARHRTLAELQGRAALHAELALVDAESARRLHPNDLVRVSRALEVHELTGRTMSEWQARHGFATVRHQARLFAVARDRDALSARIERRVEAWLAQGWIEETRDLLARGYGEARAMGSVGYKEIREHLMGRLPREELPRAISRATRVFARRQRTWLNHADVTWLEEDRS